MDVPVLHNRPDHLLPPELSLLLTHFISLSRQRPPAFGAIPVAIPMAEMESFHRVFGVADYMPLPEFVTFMVELDTTLIDHYAKIEEAKEGAKQLNAR